MNPAPAPDLRRDSLICSGLLIITIALFWPAASFDFINLDDPDYVTENPVVQAGITWSGLHWAFGASHANNWHPMTWISHMLDCQSFGLHAGAHHLVNVALHIGSTLLLFLALRRMTGAAWRSALVAALFAWHPLHVESVAWVAERKDVLSAFFFMLTLWAYAHRPSPIFYLLSLLFFALGLMSKPMLVTLPFILLLLDYWPLRRFELDRPRQTLKRALPLLWEKLPFFVCSLVACVLTFLAQRAGGAVESLEQLPLGSRVANALVACTAYLAQMAWPSRLAVFYPHVPLPLWQTTLSAVLLVCVSLLCLRAARARPSLLVGWCWFCVMLVPVIGLVQVGWQARADRYTYLPLIGIFLMISWAPAALGRTARLGLVAGAALLLGACLVLTHLQLDHWRNSTALFSHALQVTSGNWLAHNNLGTALAVENKLDDAAAHFRAAIEINPGYDDARSNLGRYFAQKGQGDTARAQLEGVLRHNPNHFRAHRNLGYCLVMSGNVAQGALHYAEALRLHPGDTATTHDLAAVLTKQPCTAPPAQLKEALKLLPTKELRARVAGAWAAEGSFACAALAYRAALELGPPTPDVLNNFAWMLATCPDSAIRSGAEAVRLAEQACQLTSFNQTLIVGTLAAAYAEAGRFSDAVATGQRAAALAVASGDAVLASKNRELLELYRAGRPYHTTTDTTPPGQPVSNP